jgi:hypothetical protein
MNYSFQAREHESGSPSFMDRINNIERAYHGIMLNVFLGASLAAVAFLLVSHFTKCLEIDKYYSQKTYNQYISGILFAVFYGVIGAQFKNKIVFAVILVLGLALYGYGFYKIRDHTKDVIFCECNKILLAVISVMIVLLCCLSWIKVDFLRKIYTNNVIMLIYFAILFGIISYVGFINQKAVPAQASAKISSE